MRLEDKLRLAVTLTVAAFALLCAAILTSCAAVPKLEDFNPIRASDLLAMPEIPPIPGPDSTQEDLFDAYVGTLKAARVCYLGREQ